MPIDILKASALTAALAAAEAARASTAGAASSATAAAAAANTAATAADAAKLSALQAGVAALQAAGADQAGAQWVYDLLGGGDRYRDGARRAWDGSIVAKGPEYPTGLYTGRNTAAEEIGGGAALVTRTTQAMDANGGAAAAGVIPGDTIACAVAPTYTDLVGFLPLCVDPAGRVIGFSGGGTLLRLAPGSSTPEVLRAFDRTITGAFCSPGGVLFASIATNINANPSGGQLWRSADDGATWTKVLDYTIGAAARWGMAFKGSTVLTVEYGYKQADNQARRVYRSTDGGETFAQSWELPGGSVDQRHCHAIACDPFTGHFWLANGDDGGFKSPDTNRNIWRSTDDGVSFSVVASGYQPIYFAFTPDDVLCAQDAYPFGVVAINKTTLKPRQVLDLDTYGKGSGGADGVGLYATQGAALLRTDTGAFYFATYAQTANTGKHATTWAITADLKNAAMADDWGTALAGLGSTGIVHAVWNPVDRKVYAWATWADSSGTERLGCRIFRAPKAYTVSAARTSRSVTNLANSQGLDPINTNNYSGQGSATVTYDAAAKWRPDGTGTGAVYATCPGVATNNVEGLTYQIGGCPAGTLSGGAYVWSDRPLYALLQIRDATAGPVQFSRLVAVDQNPRWFDFGSITVASANSVVQLTALNNLAVAGQKIYLGGILLHTGKAHAGRPEISGTRNTDQIRLSVVQPMQEGTIIATLRADTDWADGVSGAQPLYVASLAGTGEVVNVVYQTAGYFQLRVGTAVQVYASATPPGTPFVRGDVIRVIARWGAGVKPDLQILHRGKVLTAVAPSNTPTIGINSLYLYPLCEGGTDRSWIGAGTVALLPKRLTDAQVAGEFARDAQRIV